MLNAVQLRALAAREKHRAAIHEAGHLTVLQWFGGVGDARIWPTKKADLSLRAWVGQVRVFAPAGSITNDALVTLDAPHRREFRIARRVPRDWSVLVGLAGVVAEEMSDVDDPATADPAEVFEAVQSREFVDDFSQTDRAMVGDNWTFGQLKRTSVLLSRRWPHVLSIARDLKRYPGNDGR